MNTRMAKAAYGQLISLSGQRYDCVHDGERLCDGVIMMS